MVKKNRFTEYYVEDKTLWCRAHISEYEGVGFYRQMQGGFSICPCGHVCNNSDSTCCLCSYSEVVGPCDICLERGHRDH